MTHWIKFLGTAGARFVMIRQLRSSAGVWYHLNGMNILVDPGPGTLVKCASSRPRLDPTKLDVIILTHKHIDHSTDVNVMIEAMTDGGFRSRGRLFAPRDALEGDPVILQYVRSFPEELIVLQPESAYDLADRVTLRTSPRHIHPVETYGLRFELPDRVIGHLVDTAYFDDLVTAYAGVDVLILHVVRFSGEGDEEKGIQHLNLGDAEKIIAAVKPRLAVLTHFGMTMLKARPWELAQQLTDRLGIKVVAANDGMQLNLDEW
ncbi:MAG: MBL fold metallo-hydrolase [Calditrichaeota bacterium]|nr:MBL fold metallo-hydrolase [Calditrichota bacterium]